MSRAEIRSWRAELELIWLNRECVMMIKVITTTKSHNCWAFKLGLYEVEQKHTRRVNLRARFAKPSVTLQHSKPHTHHLALPPFYSLGESPLMPVWSQRCVVDARLHSSAVSPGELKTSNCCPYTLSCQRTTFLFHRPNLFLTRS